MSGELIEKAEKFGEKVIRFCKEAKKDIISQPIISQLIKSSTSIGVACVKLEIQTSRNLLISKFNSCKSYCLETKHWIRMIAEADIDNKDKCRELWKDTNELISDFNREIDKYRIVKQ